MKFDFLKAMQFQSGEAIVSRSGGRGVIGTINAQIISLCAAHLRSSRLGVPVENPTLDGHAEMTGQTEGERQEATRTAEQGGETPREAPLVVAGRLKLIRDVIDASLRANAGQRELPLADAGGRVQYVPDPFHIGQPISETMVFLCSSVQEVSPVLITEQANALGITEDEVKKALAARPAQRQQFLFRNRDDILALAKDVVAADRDGMVLGTKDPVHVEMAFDALEPITKSALMASADRSLYKAWQREIQRHVDGQMDAMSNIGLLNGIRIQLREQFGEWMKDEGFYRAYSTAIERGAKTPSFGALPTKPKPMQHESARKAA